MPGKIFEMLSDSLTPNEVKNKEFKRAVWGYSPDQVVEFLDTVSKSWERVQKRERELIEEIRLLNEEIAGMHRREAEIEAIRQKAFEDAEKTREQGKEEAAKYFQEVRTRSDEIRVKTEEWLANLIGQVEETERRRNSFLSAFKSALDQHYELLNTDLEQNRGLESQLTGFLSAMEAEEELPASPSQHVSENQNAPANLI